MVDKFHLNHKHMRGKTIIIGSSRGLELAKEKYKIDDFFYTLFEKDPPNYIFYVKNGKFEGYDHLDCINAEYNKGNEIVRIDANNKNYLLKLNIC